MTSEANVLDPAAIAPSENTNWPDYDGNLYKSSVHGEVYLMMNGNLNHVPDFYTFQSLFVIGTQVNVNDYVVDTAPMGPALSQGAVLVCDNVSPDIYLVTWGVKMHVPNPATMTQFHFNNPTPIPPIVLGILPVGSDVG